MNNNQFPEEILEGKDTFVKYYSGFFYKNVILKKEYFPNQIDDWYEKINYARFDSDNNVIYPKKSFLKQYSVGESSIQRNINFVTDAFLDLKKYYDDNYLKNKFIKKSLYSNLVSHRSTEDGEASYVEYIKNLYGLYEEFFIKTYVTNNPHSMQSFIKRFISFLQIYLKFGILNRSTYLKSNLVTSHIDGLRISLDPIMTDVTYAKKANLYVSDPEFNSFIEKAGLFGFSIDKNRPWVIIFNLDSQYLKKYASVYGLFNKKQILDECYYKAYKVDLENLNNLIVTFWNNYAYKTKESLIDISSNSCFIDIKEKIVLKQLTQETFEKIFNINWQLRFYAYTRVLEEQIGLSQQKFDLLHQDACKINKLHGAEEALLFINKKINLYTELQKPLDVELTTETEFYKLLEKQADVYKESEIRF